MQHWFLIVIHFLILIHLVEILDILIRHIHTDIKVQTIQLVQDLNRTKLVVLKIEQPLT